MANILLVTHIYPPATDGGSKVIAKIGDYLQSQGHQTMVLTSNCSSTDDFISARRSPISIDVVGPHSHQNSNVINIKSSKVLSNVPKYYSSIAPAHHRSIAPIFRLPVYTFLRRPFKLFSPLSSLFSVCQKGPIFKIIPFIKALIFILKFRPDYIIAGPLPTTIVLYARLIRFISRVLAHQRTKLIINPCFHPTDQSFQQPILINTLKSADFIWTLTDFETDYFHKNFKIPKIKIITAGCGIDQSFLTIVPANQCTNALISPKSTALANQRSKALLFIGSFAAHKGIETLIDAFVLLSSSKALKFPHSNVLSSAPAHQRTNALSLTLAGQPTLYSPIIENKINALPANIKSKIKIIYNFKSSALADLLDQSSILISPSTQESFGLVLIEAWARGKPVIAANIPASSELIQKTRGGLTFIKNDVHDLAFKINKILKSSSLSATFGQNGFNYVSSHYTWDKIGKTIWQNISS